MDRAPINIGTNLVGTRSRDSSNGVMPPMDESKILEKTKVAMSSEFH